EDPMVVDTTLREARAALDAGDAATAHRLLQRIRKSSLLANRPEFGELNRQALAGLVRASAFSLLGRQRGLVDPQVAINLKPLDLGLSPLAAGRLPAEFVERNPHAEALMKEFSLPPTQLPLFELANMLHDVTGANVVLDNKALEESGIASGE